MDDAVLVRVGEAGAHVDHDLELAAQTSRVAAADEVLGQRVARDVLHRDEGLAFVLADVVDGDDVRVLQAGGEPRLAHRSAREPRGC